MTCYLCEMREAENWCAACKNEACPDCGSFEEASDGGMVFICSMCWEHVMAERDSEEEEARP